MASETPEKKTNYGKNKMYEHRYKCLSVMAHKTI